MAIDLGKNNESNITTLLFFKRFYKSLIRTVIGLFYIIGKEAGGQFVIPPVILQALTAIAFPVTRRIGAITVREIGFTI